MNYSSYTPIDPDFYDRISELKDENTTHMLMLVFPAREDMMKQNKISFNSKFLNYKTSLNHAMAP